MPTMLDTQSDPAAAPIEQLTLPRHIAIIMDGNGRWAQARGEGRTFGHRAGATSVRSIVTECARLGMEALTLYSFSTENWSRSPEEVDCLMDLYVEYLVKERSTMIDNNIRFRQIGRRQGLPRPVLAELDESIELTRDNTGMTLALAINYGSRSEITDAVRAIARKVATGDLAPEDIEQATIDAHLYTAGMPDPDLLIRTAGEKRVSNYLLWQISYAEIHVADCCWPDFDVPQLHAALRDYASRKRKFGGVPGAS
jgi:undecaprenyl diphosphate synthase